MTLDRKRKVDVFLYVDLFALEYSAADDASWCVSRCLSDERGISGYK